MPTLSCACICAHKFAPCSTLQPQFSLLPILLLRFVVGKNESATNLQFEPVECHSKAAIDLSTPASAPHLGSEAHLVSPEVVDELLAQHHIERLNCLGAV